MSRLISASLMVPGISLSLWPPWPSGGVAGFPQLRSQACIWVISWLWLLTMLLASLRSSGRSVWLSTSLAISMACWWWGIMFWVKLTSSSLGAASADAVPSFCSSPPWVQAASRKAAANASKIRRMGCSCDLAICVAASLVFAAGSRQRDAEFLE